jgi:pyruvate,water dikinase
MQKKPEAIVWFDQVTKQDIPTVGGKGANLGEMTRAKIPVPPGFIVTSSAYFDFIESTGVQPQIRALLEGLDVEDSKTLATSANKAKELIMHTPLPESLAKQIRTAYDKLGGGLVAVRSSATAEDLPEASFAGQQSTYLNQEGADMVVHAVQMCWASLFEPRAVYYRHEQKFDHFKVGIAVPVQRMVQSVTSGVVFTIEPITHDPSKIVIEVIYGLGEGLVSGEINPDLFIVSKEGPAILSRRISHQDRRLVRNTAGSGEAANYWQQVPVSKQEQQKLSDEDVLKLAELAIHIEKHYGMPRISSGLRKTVRSTSSSRAR